MGHWESWAWTRVRNADLIHWSTPNHWVPTSAWPWGPLDAPWVVWSPAQGQSQDQTMNPGPHWVRI